eukprot:Platyproteum_vivax@DN4120_c0_g1_i1.p1
MRNTFHVKFCQLKDSRLCIFSCCCPQIMSFAQRVALLEGGPYKCFGCGSEVNPVMVWGEICCCAVCSIVANRHMIQDKYNIDKSIGEVVLTAICPIFVVCMQHQHGVEIEKQSGQPLDLMPCLRKGLAGGIGEGQGTTAPLRAPSQQNMND